MTEDSSSKSAALRLFDMGFALELLFRRERPVLKRRCASLPEEEMLFLTVAFARPRMEDFFCLSVSTMTQSQDEEEEDAVTCMLLRAGT
jgi:hypothetical protein